MSGKAISLATMAVGGSSGVLGVAYLSGAFGLGVDYELPKTFEAFKSGKEGEKVEGCVLSLFPNLSEIKREGTSDFSDNNKVGTGFFGDPKNGEKMSGCLVVNWDKEKEKTGNKGKGTFRFLGAVKQGNKGFVTFVSAEHKTGNTDKKLDWDGMVYELKDEQKKGDGQISRKLERNSSKDNGGELSKSSGFPNAGTAIDVTKKNFGGFVDSEDELDASKTCSTNECQNNMNKSSLRGYGTLEDVVGENPEAKSLDGGTSSLSTGGDKLFDNTKGNMGEVVNSKKVKGKKQVFLKEPKQEVTASKG